MEWAQLKAKVPKCRSMVIQGSTGKRVSPQLSIGGEAIPPAENDSFKFLGMRVRVYKNNNTARDTLRQHLKQMLSAIDDTPLTRQQKLRLFRHGVCPRLSWSLLIEEFPISWLERELQPLATRALKKWAGLTRSSNASILFLPAKRGGLALPSLVSLYKTVQATRMVQLLTSLDPGVRKAGDLHLVEERARRRLKFRPAVLVESILSQDHSQSRRALKRATKAIIQEEEDDERHRHLCQLPSQGEMARSWKESSPELWVEAVQGLPPDPLKFALCASTNSLPTNANLKTWGKKSSDICQLCRNSRQSLPHVLNNCPAAMDLRRYSKRHDEVLQVVGDFIRAQLPPLFSITIDSPSESYCFPHHITPTTLRPDIVWWSEQRSELWLFELTIHFESVVASARERKRTKYYDLVEAGRAAGFRCELITLEVGSRGMLSAADLEPLQAAIEAPRKEVVNLCLSIIRTTILESFRIWASRNCSI
jgi:hypothetical protein